MAGVLTYRLLGPDRSIFLPGQTSGGHHQIELACSTCHTPWMGVKEQACYDCHAAELKLANDSHPKSKFTDPRNADRLKSIDAADCVTCHREHTPEQTRSMGVTMPDDYCFHCHQETQRDRPSHNGFAFNSCATAGCHNYHDNTALYEDFLLTHAREPEIKHAAARPTRKLLEFLIESERWKPRQPLTAAQADAPREIPIRPTITDEWAMTAHAKAGVNCTECHSVEGKNTRTRHWSSQLDFNGCVSCHREETDGFLAGKHGMRLAKALPPMKPALARVPMKASASQRELTCASCHGAHQFDARQAAVEACLSCHDDAHSLAYMDSAHFALWQAELAGRAPAGSGVSCATCHLPREVRKVDSPTRVLVQHNQNANLRPNEKMIRSVCLDCHGLSFSLDALADAALVQANFIGRPKRHVESIDLALRRQMEQRNAKSKP